MAKPDVLPAGRQSASHRAPAIEAIIPCHGPKVLSRLCSVLRSRYYADIRFPTAAIRSPSGTVTILQHKE